MREIDLLQPLAQKRVALYFFVLTFALALCFPTLLEFRSDEPILFGRYSRSYLVVLASFGALATFFLGLGVYARGHAGLVRRMEHLLEQVWRHPIIAWSLTVSLVLVFGLVCVQLAAWTVEFELHYQALLLLGVALFFSMLIVGLLCPWLARNKLPLAFLNQPRFQMAIIALGALALATILFGNILNRQWWWFDDSSVAAISVRKQRQTYKR